MTNTVRYKSYLMPKNRKIKNIQKRMEELNKLIIYDLKDATVQ